MDDTGHPPHASFRGDQPYTSFVNGPFGIKVRLITWGPNDGSSFAALYNRLIANWGMTTSRIGNDKSLSEDQWAYVHKAFEGGTLQQALEAFTFSFRIEGITRACTHQLVRTRIGAGMMQQGGRDNDWRHADFTIPETVRRAQELIDKGIVDEKFKHCVVVPNRLVDYSQGVGLARRLCNAVKTCKEAYAALVDAGIPWQDARRWLPIGCQTYIFIDYNWVALKGVLSNRLEHCMDWEINCVAQLMQRECKRLIPEFMHKNLMSHSDRAGKAVFAKMDSWPPDGKHPVPPVTAKETHPDDIKRTHSPEQMPYWVLAPESMDGDDIRWIPTNGTFPHEEFEKYVIHKAVQKEREANV